MINRCYGKIFPPRIIHVTVQKGRITMEYVKQISDDLYWVGASDRRLALFENVYPIPRGVSYNSYLLMDEKTVLLDTVDKTVSRQFLENIRAVLNGRALDYLVVNHMEPDHCAVMDELVLNYPQLKIICNAKTMAMIKQFYDFDIDSRAVLVKEMDTFNSGRHTLSFIMAPMVHWPEVMVTWDCTDGILFSADAFGTFGAISGNLYADEVDVEKDWADDYRRYYTNIVGKYGVQVQALLKKAAALDIRTICPLHGLIWRENISWLMDKYQAWSTYTPEEKSVTMFYGSIYGNTENAVDILAGKLADRGIRNITVYDTSKTDPSYLVSEAFRCSHIVFASSTYNGGIFSTMENLLHEIAAHNLQNRTFAVIQNGSWGPASGRLMKDILSGLKNNTILDEELTLKSALKPEQEITMDQLADAIAASVLPEFQTKSNNEKEISAMKKYVCQVCGYVYDEAEGDPEHGIAPGTKWEDLPDDYECPLCFVGKDQFEEA